MKCYACNCSLESPVLDKPTTRYYCSTCMEPTNQIILQKADEELDAELKDTGLFGIVEVLNKHGWLDLQTEPELLEEEIRYVWEKEDELDAEDSG